MKKRFNKKRPKGTIVMTNAFYPKKKPTRMIKIWRKRGSNNAETDKK